MGEETLRDADRLEFSNVSLGGCRQPGERHRPGGDWKGVRSAALGVPGASALSPSPRRPSSSCGLRRPGRRGRGRAGGVSPVPPPPRPPPPTRCSLSCASPPSSAARSRESNYFFPPEELRTPAGPPREKPGVERPPTSRRPRPRPGRSGGASAVSEGRAEQPTGLFVLPRAAQPGPGARLQALRPERPRPPG